MKPFDVQSIGISTSARKAFNYIALPQNLPNWTNAFAQADETSATMATPDGDIPITLATHTDTKTGSIDWEMTFPDGSQARAYSRVTENGPNSSIYSFVLMAPPAPLEMLEGALEAQKTILSAELKKLAGILSA